VLAKFAGDVFRVSPTFASMSARACLTTTVSHFVWRPMGTQD